MIKNLDKGRLYDMKARDEISDEEFEKEMEFSIRQAESGETQLAKEAFAEIKRELK